MADKTQKLNPSGARTITVGARKRHITVPSRTRSNSPKPYFETPLPIADEDYGRWIESGKTKWLIYFAAMIAGYKPPAGECLIHWINEAEGSAKKDLIIPETVRQIYLKMKSEITAKEQGKQKYNYVRYEDVRIKSDKTVISASWDVIEDVCRNAGIALPDDYHKHRKAFEEHYARCETDFVYATNAKINEMGADVPRHYIGLAYWGLAEACCCVVGWDPFKIRYDSKENLEKYIYGRNCNKHMTSQDELRRTWVAISSLYPFAEAAGKKKEYLVLNIDEYKNEPYLWQVDPESFLIWCNQKDIALRLQLRGNNSKLKPIKRVSTAPEPMTPAKGNARSLHSEKNNLPKNYKGKPGAKIKYPDEAYIEMKKLREDNKADSIAAAAKMVAPKYKRQSEQSTAKRLEQTFNKRIQKINS